MVLRIKIRYVKSGMKHHTLVNECWFRKAICSDMALPTAPRHILRRCVLTLCTRGWHLSPCMRFKRSRHHAWPQQREFSTSPKREDKRMMGLDACQPNCATHKNKPRTHHPTCLLLPNLVKINEIPCHVSQNKSSPDRHSSSQVQPSTKCSMPGPPLKKYYQNGIWNPQLVSTTQGSCFDQI